jgi:folate-binding protein YgfZ
MNPAEFLQDTRSRLETMLCAIQLPPRVRITASGPDTLRFLNGQMSNQMEKSQSSAAIASCLLTIKGRIVSVPVCWRGAQPDAFVLEVPAELGEVSLQRLERYLIADQVELSDEPAPHTWHVTGHQSCELQLPGMRSFPRFGNPGWDLDGELPGGTEVDVLSETEAEALRIWNKIPGSGEFAGEVFPAEVGLDSTAVDFHKGCYLGQEVVSRLESVGKVRRTFVNWTATKAPAAGANLCAAPGERVLGRITTVLELPCGGVAGLAIVREELANPGIELHALDLQDPSKPTVTLQILS